MPNRLIHEQSPYLLQHAHNPVDWYPWGDEAFARAAAEQKPVLVSIGYAACHWCHVMERESFEDSTVAAFMNEHFICIKVDREEHPDVDHMYMDAVQAIAGNGGWPLNVFVTPGRMPFYGGTYYPPRPAYQRLSWQQLLHRMLEVWHTQPEEVALQANQLAEHLRQSSQKAVSATTGMAADWEMCRAIATTLLKMADKEKGGFGNAPKFPGTMAISFLLEHYHYTGHEPSLQQATLSLDAMCAGGIYDQLAGGFARYSTDREWLAPHFEKMLYDNALLVVSLCDAYAITKKELYATTIIDTIAFVERELKEPTGGYYCAIDADSEGVEGKFYTWAWEEWLQATGGNEAAAMHFGVLPQGNWDGTNILHIAKNTAAVAEAFTLTEAEVTEQIARVKQQLLQVRGSRIRPITDDKSLLPWNALMNTALTKAAMVLRQSHPQQSAAYLDRATSHMEWMVASFKSADGWLHTWKNGQARIAAKLDGYAYLAQAMLQLATASQEHTWILEAGQLIDGAMDDFSSDGGYFYYSSQSQTDIAVRKIDLYDGATPSANAVMAHNLLLCGMCLENTGWIAKAREMVMGLGETVMRYSYSFGYWAILLQRMAAGPKTVVCAGPGSNEDVAEILSKSVPHAYILALGEKILELPVLKNKNFVDRKCIFVCTEQECLAPVSSASQAFRLLNHYENH